MRRLSVIEVNFVSGGQGFPNYPQWPDRSEVERQVQELRDFLEEQDRRNSVKAH